MLEAISRDGSYLINIPLKPEGTFVFNSNLIVEFDNAIYY